MRMKRDVPCDGCLLVKVPDRFFETNDIDTLVFSFCDRVADRGWCCFWPDDPSSDDMQDADSRSPFPDDPDLPF